MASHTIVAIYDTPAHAKLAIGDLEEAGIPASSIEHYTQETAPGLHDPADPHAPASDEPHHHTGFWAWLTGEDTTAEHHALYDRSIESGGTVVTVIANETDEATITSILEQHAPIDMEERASTYVSQSGVKTSGAAATTIGAASPATEEVIALAEESLQIGKRAVQAGVTRVRRYVVERPVEEQVRLRDETVKVFRRPATGSTTTTADAFKDRTIEVAHTTEEVVVGKTAHIVEEVVVQKGSQERVETVHETIRREEVEITGPDHGAGSVTQDGLRN